MKKKRLILFLVAICVVFLLGNFLILNYSPAVKTYQVSKDIEKRNKLFSLTENKIYNKLRDVVNKQSLYTSRNAGFYILKKNVTKYFKLQENIERHLYDLKLGLTSHWGDSGQVTYPDPLNENSWKELAHVRTIMQSWNFIKSLNFGMGTQLKIILELDMGTQVVFKPSWYKIEDVIEGPVYAGKDRFNSEIVGFMLGAALNFRSTPVAVGRKINMKDVYDMATERLKPYMLTKARKGGKVSYCLYGNCHYCSINETVCGDENNEVDGVILHHITGTLHKHNSPWQRTYNISIPGKWETDLNYCQPLKGKMNRTRLLDLIDAAIFDYLIQNGDRHHYETRDGRVMLIDNGKGFGNPYKDHLDILAPLYQCCILRKSTWDRLLLFAGNGLSEIIRLMSNSDLYYPLLTDAHYKALDRRMKIVYATVEYCRELYGNDVLNLV